MPVPHSTTWTNHACSFWFFFLDQYVRKPEYLWICVYDGVQDPHHWRSPCSQSIECLSSSFFCRHDKPPVYTYTQGENNQTTRWVHTTHITNNVFSIYRKCTLSAHIDKHTCCQNTHTWMVMLLHAQTLLTHANVEMSWRESVWSHCTDTWLYRGCAAYLHCCLFPISLVVASRCFIPDVSLLPVRVCLVTLSQDRELENR